MLQRTSSRKWKDNPQNERGIFLQITYVIRTVSRINVNSHTHTQKTKPLNLKWAEDLNRHFSKRGIQTSISTWKDAQQGNAKSKTTTRYQFTPLGCLYQKDNNEKPGILLVGKVVQVALETIWQFPKSLNMELHMTQQYHSSVYTQEKWEHVHTLARAHKLHSS